MIRKNPYINFLALTGIVVSTTNEVVNGRLLVKARVRITSGRGKPALADCIGVGNIANVMYITCMIGNIIYIEGEIANTVVSWQAGKVEAVTPYINVNHCECLSKHLRKNEPSTIIEILDNLDPIGYIKKEREKFTRKEKKDG